MTTKKNLVKQMFMNILTAGIFTFGFTACTDDALDGEAAHNISAGADTALLEAYGLSYETFLTADDVIILDADTTQLSVSKAYADQQGITSFVNHPMGIWHSKRQLPYIRKVTAEKLVGDRYILDVVPATLAEVIGDKKVNLQTDIYVNSDDGAVKTRAAASNIPEYAARYVDANNVIHPAVIHLTDPYGYDADVHYPGDQPSAAQTRAAQSGDYPYITAEEMAAGNTRWGIRKRLLAFNNSIGNKMKFAAKGSKDSVFVEYKLETDFELNYFLTLEGGLKWSGILPDPYVKTFETGVDGHFDLGASLMFGFEKEWSTEDKLEFELAKFPGYTYSFFVGPVPVAIEVKPNLFMKFDGKVSGAVTTGCTYEYGNKFMGGGRYTDGRGWEGIGYFEETKNEFKIKPAQLDFTFECGMGLYLGADILIYKCAGPEFAVGPHIGGKLNVNVSPFDAQDVDDIVDVEGEIKLDINAVLGAKLTLLGYKLAETEVVIPMAGPWVLAKYPSDGTEHKVGDTDGVKAAAPAVTEWTNFYNHVGNGFKQDMQNIINMLKEINGCDEVKARQMLIKRLQDGYNNEPEFNNAAYADLCTELRTYQQEVEQMYYDYQYQKAGESGNTEWINAENWKKICRELLSSIRIDSNNNTEAVLNDVHQWFVNEFGREPRQGTEDIAWIAGRLHNYAKYKSDQQYIGVYELDEIKEYLISSHPEYSELVGAVTLNDMAKEAVFKFRDTYNSKPGKNDARLHQLYQSIVDKYIADKKQEQRAKEQSEKEQQKSAQDAWSQVLAKLQTKYADFYKNQTRNFSKCSGKAHNSFKRKFSRDVTTSDADFKAICQLFEAQMKSCR